MKSLGGRGVPQSRAQRVREVPVHHSHRQVLAARGHCQRRQPRRDARGQQRRPQGLHRRVLLGVHARLGLIES